MVGWWSFNAWIYNNDWNYDRSILVLDHPIGSTTGWLGYGYDMDDSWFMNSNLVLNSIGYPATDNWGNPVFEQGERMYAWQGYMDYVENGDPNVLCHHNPGYHGQSGSALYWKDPNNNRYVLGNLSHGDGYNTCHTKFDQDWFNFVYGLVASVESHDPVRLVVYPDPVVDHLFVRGHVNGASALNYTVVDLMGRTCAQGGFVPSQGIDVGDLPLGEYILDLVAGDEHYRSRFVKQ